MICWSVALAFDCWSNFWSANLTFVLLFQLLICWSYFWSVALNFLSIDLTFDLVIWLLIYQSNLWPNFLSNFWYKDLTLDLMYWLKICWFNFFSADLTGDLKGEQKNTSQSFFTITRSKFTQILKSWTFFNSSSSWLLKNVQDHWIWVKNDRDMAITKKNIFTKKF